jgi:carboxyl-terminal processing protease
MLGVIKNEIKKNYYDPTYRGVDVDARFKAADEKIKAVDSLGQAYGVIAQVMTEFEDSHLFFLPPPRPARADYGWLMQPIGNEVYITSVKPGSDAESKGLKAGDRVLKVDGFAPNRNNIWKMYYRYNILRPQPGIQVTVQTADESPRDLDLKAKVVKSKRTLDFKGDSGVEDIEAVLRDIAQEDHLNRHRYLEFGDAFIWKMPQFDFNNEEVDDMMNKAARKKALILDLRGNGGGAIATLERVVGNLFDRDTKIADVKSRKDAKPILAKTRGDKSFKGQVIVLVDSNSGSSAELLARVIQIEKRGTIIGDVTAGAVMRSRMYSYEMGGDSVISYAVSVTNADLIMADGKSLEHAGVTPDEHLAPTGADLLAGRDPVLARAAELSGGKLDPLKAGALFPFEWRR